MWKQIAIVSYLSSAVYMLSLSLYHVGNYKNNIYTILPLWSWVTFGLTIGIGAILWYDGVRRRSKRELIHASSILLTTFGVFWFFPQLIGLPFHSAPRSDLLQHYGDSTAIFATGEIPVTDVYPAIHILLATLHSLTDIRFGSLGTLLSFIYHPLLITGLGLVTRRFSNAVVAGYVVFAGLPLYFGTFSHHLVPWMAYFALIPLFLLLFVQYSATVTEHQRILVGSGVTVFAVGLAIGHPMSSVIGYVIVVAVAVSQRISKYWLADDGPSALSIAPRLLLPIVVAYPIWYLSRVTFQRFLEITVLSLVSSGSEGTAALAGRAGSSGYTLQQLLVNYVILDWGPAILALLLSFCVAVIVTYRILKRRASIQEAILVTIYGLGGSMAVIMLVANLIARGPIRTNQVTIAAGIVLIGVAVWWLTEKAESSPLNAQRLALVGVLVFAVITTPFFVFSSQSHITESEFEGTEHHIQYLDSSHPTYMDSMSPVATAYLRGSHRTFGYDETVLSRSNNQLPKYLGYRQNETIDTSLSSDSFYLLTKQRDMEWWKQEPPNRYEHIRYYSEQNHTRLHSDSSVHQVYSNGAFWIWRSTTENNTRRMLPSEQNSNG